ncbi:MAG: O-methyltransferase [Acidimicrobiales bacterium]|nr:MAG: O-methyltransferase [Acidimicrobiales bacterium]
MSPDPKSFLLDERIHSYMLSSSTALDEVERWLISTTAELGPAAGMQISPEQAIFFRVLTTAMGARRVLEIGTFTGLSTLEFARGVGPGGQVTTCDISVEWTAIARQAWDRAGVADRVELHLKPALEFLADHRPSHAYDIAFLDADKRELVHQYELVLPLVREGGVILVDNVLWSGRVLDPSDDPDVSAIRQLNDLLVADARVDNVLLPISDGLAFAVKVRS